MVIVKKIKLENTAGKLITTLAGIRKKLLTRQAGYLLGRSNKLCIIWRILIMLTKFPLCFLKYDFLIYYSFLFLYMFHTRSI